MPIEQIIQAVIAATPAKRARIVAVLNGSDKTQPSGEKRETRLVSITGAAKLLAISRNSVYRLIKTSRLEVREICGASKVTMQSINEFLDGKRPANDKTKKLIEESAAKHAASQNRKVA